MTRQRNKAPKKNITVRGTVEKVPGGANSKRSKERVISLSGKKEGRTEKEKNYRGDGRIDQGVQDSQGLKTRKECRFKKRGIKRVYG